MIRSFVLAVLAAIPMFASSAEPSACDVTAYVVDEDPAGLNVRSEGSRNGSVVARLHNADLVHIVASSNGWVRIDRADTESADGDYVAAFAGEGWVHGSKVGVGVAANENQGTDLRAEPQAASRVLLNLAYDDTPEATLLACRGTWLQLDYGKGRKGWVSREKVCANTRTECS